MYIFSCNMKSVQKLDLNNFWSILCSEIYALKKKTANIQNMKEIVKQIVTITVRSICIS